MLFDAGYAGIDWPVEGGGRGASPVEQLIYLEELERAHAPYVGVNFVGLRGSDAHDAISWDATAGAYRRDTNRAGGVEGGITTGEPVVARVGDEAAGHAQPAGAEDR